ncbi:hypothetical protein LZ30DRAFT_686067 [Colletotrichum cereale]|nr:hypothetical protein LZ30DRAFT_686067 [Colletotrichum cereale]
MSTLGTTPSPFQKPQNSNTAVLVKYPLGCSPSDIMGSVSSSSCANAFNETILQQQSTQLDACESILMPKPPKPPTEWKDMPAEIRLMILERIAQAAEAHSPPNKGSLSTVCAEWRSFLERRNFESLRLESLEDVIFLDHCVSGRREGLVKTITLFVHLQAYDCRRCDRAENDNEKKFNNFQLSRVLLRLLDVLSSWSSPRAGPKNDGVILEIGAASTNDIQHAYTKLGGIVTDPAIRETQHWMQSHLRRFSNEGSKKRTLGCLLDFDIDCTQRIFGKIEGLKRRATVPQATTVTRLSIGYQYYRSLSAAGLEMLLSCLPCLTGIDYVYWCGIDREEQRLRHAADLVLLKKFPNTVTELTLQELYDIDLHIDCHPEIDGAVAAAALEASRRLSYFQGVNAFDAVHFFKDFYPGLPHRLDPPEPWLTLRFLALTSCSTLTPDIDPLPANQLLVAAANAALQMPKLEIMELWKMWRVDGAFVFRYQVFEDSTVIEGLEAVEV